MSGIPSAVTTQRPAPLVPTGVAGRTGSRLPGTRGQGAGGVAFVAVLLTAWPVADTS